MNFECQAYSSVSFNRLTVTNKINLISLELLTQKSEALLTWMWYNNQLLPNPSSTQLIWLGSRRELQQFAGAYTCSCALSMLFLFYFRALHWRDIGLETDPHRAFLHRYLWNIFFIVLCQFQTISHRLCPKAYACIYTNYSVDHGRIEFIGTSF